MTLEELEAEVSRLKGLLAEAYEHLQSVWDAGPEGEGWQSDELSSLCGKIFMVVHGS